MPPTEFTSPFQTVIWQGSARKGAAGPELGIAQRILAEKMGG